jgi:hypothetical protein
MPLATTSPTTPPRGGLPPIGTRGLKIICAAIVAILFVAGLWPFNLFPHNGVAWLGDHSGISFNGHGVVLASRNFSWPSPDGPCSVELWVQPGPMPVREGTILTFYQPAAPERLRIFQWNNSVLLIYRDAPGSRHQEMDMDDSLHPDTPLLITVTSGAPGHALVYLNGVLAQDSNNFTLTRGDLSGDLVLGTAPVNDFGWTGQLRGLAFYDRALAADQVSRHFAAGKGGDLSGAAQDGALASYAFDERSGGIVHDRTSRGPDLDIPAHYEIPYKPVLMAPWRDFRWDWSTAQDVAINVVGFAPFGFFFCAWLAAGPLARRAALLTLLSGAAISLTIELLQVYLPPRTSSMTDLITNTFGTLLGIVLYRIVRPRLASPRSGKPFVPTAREV